MNNFSIYQVILVISIVLIISNLKTMINLRKEKINTLYVIKYDNKGIRTLGIAFFVILVISITITIIDAIKRNSLTSNEITQAISVGLLFIGVYIPIIRKTKLTDKGILKNSSLIKWDNIKSIEYGKPNKEKIRVKVNYNTKYNKPIKVEIVFSEKNSQELIKFKEISKQYRKKGNKKGKKKN